MATFVIVFLTTCMIQSLLIHYYAIKIVIKHVVIKKLKINLIKLNVKNVVVQMENMEINTQLKMKYHRQQLKKLLQLIRPLHHHHHIHILVTVV